MAHVPFRSTLMAALAWFTITIAGSGLAFGYEPPLASKSAVAGIDFAGAAAVDDDYRAQFRKCDDKDVFRGIKLKGWRKCSGDKNNLAALLKFPAGAIFFQAKMALDLDGSWKACHSPGAADQCPTSYSWKGQHGTAAAVDSDVYPYIVIPNAGPKPHGKEFARQTGIAMGDFAVVIYDGKVVPAFVADGGPYNKIGEASNAVFAGVGKDRCKAKNAAGKCTKYRDSSLPKDILYFVFPGSARADMTPENAPRMIETEALKRFNKLKRQ